MGLIWSIFSNLKFFLCLIADFMAAENTEGDFIWSEKIDLWLFLLPHSWNRNREKRWNSWDNSSLATYPGQTLWSTSGVNLLLGKQQSTFLASSGIIDFIIPFILSIDLWKVLRMQPILLQSSLRSYSLVKMQKSYISIEINKLYKINIMNKIYIDKGIYAEWHIGTYIDRYIDIYISIDI